MIDLNAVVIWFFEAYVLEMEQSTMADFLRTRLVEWSEVISTIILSTGIGVKDVTSVWKRLFHFDKEAYHSISAFQL